MMTQLYADAIWRVLRIESSLFQVPARRRVRETTYHGSEATLLNDLKLSLQYILPKLWLTRLAGWGASKRAGWLTKLVIDLFVKYYKVDMKEAQKPDTAAYRTFNDFSCACCATTTFAR